MNQSMDEYVFKTIYITFEHGWMGAVSGDSSTMELVTHCGAY
jgi:hypothetical protein